MDREKFTLEEIGELEDYNYYTREQVKTALAQLGYGEPLMMIDAFYLKKDGKKGIGVKIVRWEDTQHHFGNIYRGVDQIEGLAQTFVLISHFGGKQPEGTKTLFDHLEEFDFIAPALTGAVLNIVVDESGYGEVKTGRTLFSRGRVVGARVDSERFDRVIARRARLQSSEVPVFPFQG